MSKITTAPSAPPVGATLGAVVLRASEAALGTTEHCPCPGRVDVLHTIAVHAQRVGGPDPSVEPFTPLGTWENYQRRLARLSERIARLEAIEESAPPGWRARRAYWPLRVLVAREQRAIRRELSEIRRIATDDAAMAHRVEAEQLSEATGLPVAVCAVVRVQPDLIDGANRPPDMIVSPRLIRRLALADAVEAARHSWRAYDRPPDFACPLEHRALRSSIQTTAPPSNGLGAVRAA
ncbi:helicase associated domain-containing protein [Streptomyces sp. NPDC090025]|uniref:helicase associated domain-containing protein n=1 Tax=Streptomyces sp. NPDC090025 TaxID=3365922 RepID=UPI0038333335